MAKILLVEDDESLAMGVLEWLGRQNYLVDWVNNGTEGFERLSFYHFDVAILDWHLPGMNGPDICRQYRDAGGQIPVIMLTARSTVADRVTGLDCGADDYLSKPVDPSELSARLRALLRRPQKLAPTVVKCAGLELDPATGKTFKHGQEVVLQPREFALLHFLMRHPGQVFSPERLLDLVWPTTTAVSRDTIKVHINKIRAKIDSPGEPSLISSVHGMGYVIKPDA